MGSKQIKTKPLATATKAFAAELNEEIERQTMMMNLARRIARNNMGRKSRAKREKKKEEALAYEALTPTQRVDSKNERRKAILDQRAKRGKKE